MTANHATETIWSQLSNDLRRFIRRRVADDHVTEDLLQETFLRIHRHVHQLEETDRVAAWVYRITRNVIHDHYRTKNRDVSLADLDVVDEADPSCDLRARAGIWLEELIDRLPPNYRDAVRLSEIDGWPQHEVAVRLGLSVSGAKSRVQRGRALLSELLDSCCTFQFDRRGRLVDCDPKPDRSAYRDCSGSEIPPRPGS